MARAGSMEPVGTVAIPVGTGALFRAPPPLLIGKNGMFRVGGREYNSAPGPDDNFGHLVGIIVSPRYEVFLLGGPRLSDYSPPFIEKRFMGFVSREECRRILSDLFFSGLTVEFVYTVVRDSDRCGPLQMIGSQDCLEGYSSRYLTGEERRVPVSNIVDYCVSLVT